MEFKIGLAGRIVGISSIYDEVYELCRDYLIGEENLTSDEDFHVTISQDDIEFEREKSIKEAIFERIVPYDYEESYYETLAVYRKIAVEMLKYDTWLMHGAVVGVNDQAVLFTAQSGVGKTTHMRLWLKNLENVYVVNGDQPLVKVGKDIMVCGSPWCGKEGWNNNVVVPLKAIVVMERGVKNSIVEISMNEALAELLRQVYKPSNSAKMGKTLQLLSLLEGRTKFYRFIFNNFAEDAFSVSYSKVHLGQ